MDQIVTASRLAVALIAICASTVLVAYLSPRWDRAAARPLLGVAAVLTIGAVGHMLIVDPAGIALGVDRIGQVPGDRWWVIQGAVVTVTAAGLWTLFAFEYTGRGGGLFAGLAAGVALLVGSAAFLAIRAVNVGLSSATVDGIAAILTVTAFIASVGVSLLLRAAGQQNAFPRVEPLLLSVGVVALLSGILLAQLLEQPWLFPATIALASGSFLATVVRYPTFDTLPAARVAGRDRVVEELSAGVIVADRDDRIRDCTERAASLFGVDAEAVLGEPFGTLPGIEVGSKEVAAAGDPATLTTERGTTLELTGSPIEGHGGRSFGTLVVCTDVTDRRSREERLEILRRFVVDTVGTRMDEVATSAASGTGEDDDRDPAARANRIWTSSTTLATLVASARDVERAIGQTTGETERPSEADLRDTIRTVADAATEENAPAVAVDLPESRLRTGVSQPLLETVLRTLLEDARQQAREQITITAVTGDPPTIRVCDDRYQGDATTVAGRSESREIPVTRLAVEHAGGTVSTTERDDTHRCVTIELPPVDTDAGWVDSAPRNDRTATPDRTTWTGDRTASACDGTPETGDHSPTVEDES
ncbi:PAS domain-containing protein [Salinarchaeum laminariae]|uniref:PAS domain-containing protein n=1 Tax=Salinarchaeum laminariae TaxID=869888 RepID=UPI0020C165C6|nr:PAS domain-containing protein [Salinarchaeum laminariae]